MWRYSVGSTSTPATWAAATFDDSTWAQGSQPLGYGESNLKTTVSMGTSLTLYARTEFDLAVTPSEFKSMTLEVDYDDGFVAFLNGTEIARRNVAAGQTYASTSTVRPRPSRSTWSRAWCTRSRPSTPPATTG
jgi:hypothetical protein